MNRVLIVKLGAIGDVIMLIPAAHQLHLAGYQVDWVCGPAVLPILQLYAWINPIVADDRELLTGSAPAKIRALLSLWRKLFKGQDRLNLRIRSYGLVATLYYDFRYRIIALPIFATRRIHLSKHREFHLLPGRHHTDEYARILLHRPDTLNPSPLAPVPVSAASLPVSPLLPPLIPRVILAPAGARNMLADDALRRWPADFYVVLATLLIAQGIEVVLVGGSDDGWISPLFSKLSITYLIGTLTLPQTLALLDSDVVLVTHDTGPLHLAGITSAGIVALFGPTDPHGRLPQRPGTVALWGGESFACRPCYDGRSFAVCPSNDCIRQYTPQMVFAETLAMLSDRARGYFAPPRIATP